MNNNNNNIEVIKSEDKTMDDRFWMDSNLAQFDDILRANYDKSLESFSDEIISYLATVTQAMRGAFFVLNDEKTHLEATGGYACTKESMPKTSFKVGEDLVGQAVKSKKVNYLKDLPLLNLTVDAAAGKMSAGSLIILPLYFNDEAYGVLELVYLHNLEDKFLDLLQRMVKNVATTLNSIQNNERTKKLLKEAQDQAEMLRTQEEELRQNLEELNTTQHSLEIAQNRLQVEAEKSRVLFESSYEAMMILSVKNPMFTDCNEAAVKIYGVNTKDGIVGKTPLDFSPELQPDGRPSPEKAMEEIGIALEKGINTFEWLHQSANGTPWMAEVKLMTFELNGEKNIQVIVRDISLKKQQERELKELNQKVQEEAEKRRVLFESSHEALVILNVKNATFIDCNEAAVKVYGANDKEGLIGKTPLDFSPDSQPDGRPSQEKAMEEISIALEKGVNTFEWLHERPDSTSWLGEIKLMTFELNGEKSIQIIVRDITLKKQQEEELKELHQKVQEEAERSRTLFESFQEALVILRVSDATFTDCNEAAVKIYGANNQEEIIGKTPLDVSAEYQPDGRLSEEKAAEVVGIALEKGGVTFEWLHERPDGTTWLAEVKLMTFELNGETNIQFILRDITLKKQEQEELEALHRKVREEAERNRIIFDSSIEAMCFMSLEIITDCNQAALDLLGYEHKEDIIGKPPLELSAEYQIGGIPTQQKVEEYVGIALEQGQHTFEWVSKRANGETFFSDVKLMAVEMNDEQILHFIFQDISERKQKEQKLLQLSNRLYLLNQTIEEGLWEISISKNSANWEDYPSWFSEHFIELLGYNPQEWVPELRTWLDIIYPKDKIKLLEQLQQNIANPEEKLTTVLRINTQTEEEEYHNFKVTSLAKANPDDQYIQLLGTLTQVT